VGSTLGASGLSVSSRYSSTTATDLICDPVPSRIFNGNAENVLAALGRDKTDEQMKAVAEGYGVIDVTFYPSNETQELLKYWQRRSTTFWTTSTTLRRSLAPTTSRSEPASTTTLLTPERLPRDPALGNIAPTTQWCSVGDRPTPAISTSRAHTGTMFKNLTRGLIPQDYSDDEIRGPKREFPASVRRCLGDIADPRSEDGHWMLLVRFHGHDRFEH
jgi:hypothetical protein